MLALIVVTYAIVLVGLWRAGIWLVNQDGQPARSDFLAVWTAGQMARSGATADAYDWAILEAAMQSIGAPTPGGMPPLGWMYPPTFLLVAAVLAVIPWTSSFLVWQAMTIAAYCATQARIAPNQPTFAIVLGLASPAALLCAVQGQTGFLTAALLGAGLLALDRRPVLAGLFFALATIKPHIGFVLPVLLVASGRWKVLLYGALFTCAFSAIAMMILGWPPWLAFLDSVRGSSGRFLFADEHRVPLQSIHSASLGFGASRTSAAVLQSVVGGLALIAALAVWRNRASDDGLRGAAALAAAFLATPYALPHDSVALAVAAGFILRHACWDQLTYAERSILLVAVVLLPAGSLLSRSSLPMPAAWLAMLGLTLWLLHRQRRSSTTHSASLEGQGDKEDSG